jgi:hypothetical protein
LSSATNNKYYSTEPAASSSPDSTICNTGPHLEHAISDMNLLDLPAELKLRIYEFYTEQARAHLCQRKRAFKAGSQTYWRFYFESPSGREVRLPFLRVCHKLRSELLIFLATGNQFRITDADRAVKLNKQIISLLPAEYVHHVKQIKCIRHSSNLLKDVPEFFPSVQKISLTCDGDVGLLKFILGNRKWSKENLERKDVRQAITYTMTMMLEADLMALQSVGEKKPVALDIEGEYGRIRTKSGDSSPFMYRSVVVRISSRPRMILINVRWRK